MAAVERLPVLYYSVDIVLNLFLYKIYLCLVRRFFFFFFFFLIIIMYKKGSLFSFFLNLKNLDRYIDYIEFGETHT